jgi:hypothetical protein
MSRRTFAELAVRVVAFAAPVVAIAMVVMPRERVRVVHATTTTLVPVPTLVEIERVATFAPNPGACPLPRHDAPRFQPAQPPELVEHVRPSITNAGWIAAWNTERVFISRDAGLSWTRILDGEGDVHDVNFDCFGRALAVRGGRIGVHDATGEAWLKLPGRMVAESHHTPKLAGGGPDIVAIGHTIDDDAWASMVAIRRGTQWETRGLAHYWTGALRGRQYEDGSIVAMVPLADCMHDDPRTFRYRDGVIEWLDIHVAADLAIYGDVIVSHYGWQRIGDKEKRDLVGLDDDSAYPTIIEGPSPMLAVGAKTYRFHEGRVTRLPYLLHEQATSIVADAAGRIWSVVCGELVIATRTAHVATCTGDTDVD